MASIEIGTGWIDAIERYVEGLQADAIYAAQEATRFFQERVKAMAEADEDWSNLADNIEVWSQDGQLVVGLNDQMMASQATVLEYGDKDHPPHPFFRTLTSAARDASQVMTDKMREAGYRTTVPKVKGMKW